MALPSGSNNRFGLSEDSTGIITRGYFGFSDPDVGDTLQAVRIDTLPLAGALRLNGVAVTMGQVITVADIDANRLTFVPVANASASGGAGYAAFTFSVSDGTGFDATPNTLTLDVYGVADRPALVVTGAPTATAVAGWNGGAPVLVAGTVDNSQFAEKTAVLANGNIAVSYYDVTNRTPGPVATEHYVRVFDPNGALLTTTAFVLDNYTGSGMGVQIAPFNAPADVVAMKGGGFAAIWRTERFDYTSSPSGDHDMLMMQFFDSAGNASGQEVRLVGDNRDIGFPAGMNFSIRDVASLDDGNIAVTYLQPQQVSGGPYFSSYDHVVKIVSPAGLVLHTIPIEMGSNSSFVTELIPQTGGGFSVIWREDAIGPSSTIVISSYLQSFNSSYAAVTAPINVSQSIGQTVTEVVRLANGNIAVAHTPGVTPNGSISITVLAPNGTVVTPSILLSQVPSASSQLLALDDGSFLVVWYKGSSALVMQRFLEDGTRIGAESVLDTTPSVMGYEPEVALTSDGKLLVQWQEVANEPGVTSQNFFLQKFDIPPLPVRGAAQALNITTAVADTDGSESIIGLTVSGLPIGFVLSDGVNSIVSASEQTPFSVLGWNLAALTVTAMAGYTGTITVRVNSTAGEAGQAANAGITASVTTELAFLPAATHVGQTFNGGASADTLNGTTGNDLFYAGDGNDTVGAGDGADLVFGMAGNDALNGGASSDTLNGGAGNDSLDGGDGTDTADYSLATSNITANITFAAKTVVGGSEVGSDAISSVEVLLFGSGSDLLLGDDVASTAHGNAGADALLGYGGNDTLDGGAGADLLFGMIGDDSLASGDGDDIVAGGVGNDNVDAGAGSDFVLAEDGDDVVAGGAARDLLYGQLGGDTLQGDTGDDFMSGGDGNDSIFGGAGLDVLYGDAGDDTVHGDADRDWIYGFDGDDMLYGDAGDDLIGAGGGLDRLFGGDGGDTMFGEAGNDTIDAGTGFDYVIGGAGVNAISLGAGLDIVQSTATDGGRQVVSDFGIADFDQIWLVGSGFASTAAALAACTQVGSNVVLQNGTDQVVLENMTVGQLNTYNFVLF